MEDLYTFSSSEKGANPTCNACILGFVKNQWSLAHRHSTNKEWLLITSHLTKRITMYAGEIQDRIVQSSLLLELSLSGNAQKHSHGEGLWIIIIVFHY